MRCSNHYTLFRAVFGNGMLRQMKPHPKLIHFGLRRCDRKVGVLYLISVFFLALAMFGRLSVSSYTAERVCHYRYDLTADIAGTPILTPHNISALPLSLNPIKWPFFCNHGFLMRETKTMPVDRKVLLNSLGMLDLCRRRRAVPFLH